jgi:hypothetical protein
LARASPRFLVFQTPSSPKTSPINGITMQFLEPFTF